VISHNIVIAWILVTVPSNSKEETNGDAADVA
jgi:hypothetical protein